MVAGGGADGNEGRYPAKEGDAYFIRLNTTVGILQWFQRGRAHDLVLAVRSNYPRMRRGDSSYLPEETWSTGRSAAATQTSRVGKTAASLAGDRAEQVPRETRIRMEAIGGRICAAAESI